MSIEMVLDKEDLINMICGTQPSYEAMRHPVIDRIHFYSDQYGRHSWQREAMRSLSVQVLTQIYYICKTK